MAIESAEPIGLPEDDYRARVARSIYPSLESALAGMDIAVEIGIQQLTTESTTNKLELVAMQNELVSLYAIGEDYLLHTQPDSRNMNLIYLLDRKSAKISKDRLQGTEEQTYKIKAVLVANTEGEVANLSQGIGLPEDKTYLLLNGNSNTNRGKNVYLIPARKRKEEDNQDIHDRQIALSLHEASHNYINQTTPSNKLKRLAANTLMLAYVGSSFEKWQPTNWLEALPASMYNTFRWVFRNNLTKSAGLVANAWLRKTERDPDAWALLFYRAYKQNGFNLFPGLDVRGVFDLFQVDLRRYQDQYGLGDISTR